MVYHSMGLFPMLHMGSVKAAMLANDEFMKLSTLEAEMRGKANVRYLFLLPYTNHYIFSKVPIN